MQEHAICLDRPHDDGQPGPIVAIVGDHRVPPERWIVNVWRDEDNHGELHVSVHSPGEKVLLSVSCDSWESDDQREVSVVLHPEPTT